jgi:triosephosphate isomerase
MALRKLVAGNWKMNGSLAALGELDAIAEAARRYTALDVAICPPFTLIAPAAQRCPALAIGAQDCPAAAAGAHTGCVSAGMIVEAGGRLAIVGHSERRADQGESDAAVQGKAIAAIAAGLVAIVCIGETEAERDAGHAEAVVTRQLRGSVPRDGTGATLVVAYEPIWAIGTGRTASADDVAAIHATIRAELRALLGEEGARVRILYGGSVKPGNARELMAVANVDGALVGGASLKAVDFVGIIEGAAAAAG